MPAHTAQPSSRRPVHAATLATVAAIALRRVLSEYLRHNASRPHRSLGQLALTKPKPFCRKQVLGCLTHDYYIAAWLPAGDHLDRISWFRTHQRY